MNLKTRKYILLLGAIGLLVSIFISIQNRSGSTDFLADILFGPVAFGIVGIIFAFFTFFDYFAWGKVVNVLLSLGIVTALGVEDYIFISTEFSFPDPYAIIFELLIFIPIILIFFISFVGLTIRCFLYFKNLKSKELRQLSR